MSETLRNILYVRRNKNSYMDVDRSLSVEKDPIHAQRIKKACPPTSLPPSTAQCSVSGMCQALCDMLGKQCEQGR